MMAHSKPLGSVERDVLGVFAALGEPATSLDVVMLSEGTLERREVSTAIGKLRRLDLIVANGSVPTPNGHELRLYSINNKGLDAVEADVNVQEPEAVSELEATDFEVQNDEVMIELALLDRPPATLDHAMRLRKLAQVLDGLFGDSVYQTAQWLRGFADQLDPP